MVGIAKSTTTPDHLYTMGLTIGFHSPHKKPPGKQPNQTADKPHEQCSQTTPPNPRAKRGKGEPMQDFQVRQENLTPELQCIQYLLEILV